MNHDILPTLAIGYPRIDDIALILDAQMPVYVSPYVDTTNGFIPEQSIDHHAIIVTQPDNFNRIHYFQIVVANLIYINGITFFPDSKERLAKVESVYKEIWDWLAERGFEVRKGLVSLPKGIHLLVGKTRHNT